MKSHDKNTRMYEEGGVELGSTIYIMIGCQLDEPMSLPTYTTKLQFGVLIFLVVYIFSNVFCFKLGV